MITNPKTARKALRGLESKEKRASEEVPFLVSPAEYVWMAGSPDGMPGAVDYGVVTYVNRIDEVTDGYRQLFITNMQRSPGGSSVLFTPFQKGI